MSTKTKNINLKCDCCGQYVKKIQGYKKVIKNEQDCILYANVGVKLQIGDIVCGRCRMKPYRKTKITAKESEESSARAFAGKYNT